MSFLNIILSPNINLCPLNQLIQMLCDKELIKLIRTCSKIYSPIELKEYYNSSIIPKNSKVLKVSKVRCNTFNINFNSPISNFNDFK